VRIVLDVGSESGAHNPVIVVLCGEFEFDLRPLSSDTIFRYLGD
jgi:hypothetical protein